MSSKEILKQIPKNWLEPYWTEYLQLNERILMTLVQVKAHESGFKSQLARPEDFQSFFESEAEKFGKQPDEIKGFFQQIAQTKAKEQIFEKHYSHLIPRDAAGNPQVSRKELEPIVGPDLQFKMKA